MFFHFNKWWMQIPVVRKSGTFTSTFLKMWWVNTCYLSSPKERNAAHLWCLKKPIPSRTHNWKEETSAACKMDSTTFITYKCLDDPLLTVSVSSRFAARPGSQHTPRINCMLYFWCGLTTYKITGNLPSANVKLTQNFFSLIEAILVQHATREAMRRAHKTAAAMKKQ